MIALKINTMRTDIAWQIERVVNNSILFSAKKMARVGAEVAKQMLLKAVIESGGTYTGRLANTIRAGNIGKLSAAIARADIVVGTDLVKYGTWIEYGRDASEGIPKKLKNSKFRGHKYLEKTIKLLTSDGGYPLHKIFIEELETRLAKMKALTTLGRSKKIF